MYPLIITANILLIIFLIVYQKITFDISISKISSVVIDYSFFSFEIKGSEKKKKSKGPKLELIFSLLKVLKQIHSLTKTKINRIIVPRSENNSAIRYGLICAIIFPALSLANSFDENFSIICSSELAPTYDFTLECRLYVFLYAFLYFLFELIKRRIRRSVRKQSKRDN